VEGSVANHGPVEPSREMSTLKSESDIASPVNNNLVIIQDAANTSDSMIDCISIAAPDDTVIKPSQLRASMRQRRTSTPTDDFSVHSPGAAVPERDKSGSGSLQRRAWQSKSLRETNRPCVVDGGTGFVRKMIVATDTSSAGSVVKPETNDGEAGNVIGRSASVKTKKLSPPSLVPLWSADARRTRTGRSAELQTLRNFSHNSASHTESSLKNVRDSAVDEANGIDGLSYDQLLHDFKEVQYKAVESCITDIISKQVDSVAVTTKHNHSNPALQKTMTEL